MPTASPPSADTSAQLDLQHHLPGLLLASGKRISLERRDAALLAYLAVEGATPRVKLLTLLWPDEDEAVLRNRLRQRLFALKRKLGAEVVAGADMLSLGATIRLSEYPSADETPPLLGEDAYADCPEFAVWLSGLRQRLRSQRRERLAAQASLLEREGRLAEAIVAAEQLLVLEPLQEHAHRRLMRMHYLRGDRAAALLAFDRCEQLLKHEVGAKPSTETLALLATIEHGQAPTTAMARRAVPASVMRPPRMVGRERELAQLERAWDAGHVATVTGEAGMGKSRLLQDFMQRHAGLVRTAGRPGDMGVPFATLARLLRAVGDLALANAELMAPHARREIARVLPEFADSSLHPGEGQRLRLRQAIASWLRASQVQGLVVDDLHFADEASLEMLRSLADNADEPTLLHWAFAFRPAEAGSPVQQLQSALAEAARLVPVPVQALDEAALVELVDDLGLEGIRGTALAPMLLKRTGGNPLFVLETLKQAWVERSLDPLAVGMVLPKPLSVGQLIDTRVAQLSRGALALARVASIAGVDFSIALAEHVLGMSAMQFSDELNELEAAQVLKDAQFAHDLVFDAVLRSVPKAIARHTHERVADWLAHQQGEPARIAQHWEQAQEWERAGQAFVPAAERAGLAGRRIESASLLADAARCYELSGNLSARFQALQARADTLAAHENGEAARRAVADAEQAAVTDQDRLLALASRADLSIMRGDYDDAFAVAHRGLAMARAQHEESSVFRFSLALASALNKLARSAEAVSLLEPLQPWVEAHAAAEQSREYWNAMALALDFSHRFAEAIQAWQRTRSHAESLGPDHVAQAVTNQAWTFFKMGRSRQAADEGLQGLRLLQSTDDDQRGRLMTTQIGVAFFLRHIGHFAQALPLFEQALPYLRDSGMGYWASTCEQGLALTFEHLGQPARAHELLAQEHAGLVLHMQAMRLAYRAELAQLTGGDGLGLMREALALLPEHDHIAYRVASLLASTVVPPDEGEALSTGLAAWASVRGRYGLALSGHVRAAACALAQGAASRALPHAEAAWHLIAEHHPENRYVGEVWLTVGRVFAALKRDAEATRVIEQGCAWVKHIAAVHVPEAFVESFLHRNPINRDLLLAAQHLPVIAS